MVFGTSLMEQKLFPILEQKWITREVFIAQRSLSVIGDSLNEEDRVVHLLASLPESYMLVTALEASQDVPK